MRRPTFLSSDPDYAYSRPCFDATGTRILFMYTRRPGTGSSDEGSERPLPTGLYTIPASSQDPPALPEVFYQPDPGTIAATRPDWCWDTGRVAFTGMPQGDRDALTTVWVVGPEPGGTARRVTIEPAGSQWPVVDNGIDFRPDNVEYPAWFPGGEYVSATNYGALQAIKVSVEDGTHQPLTAYAPPLLADPGVWTGMTTVSRRAPHPIAFAGQKSGVTYNQKTNQIWIREPGADPRPLEGPSAKEGRSPWFSPDGTKIVFESYRDTGGGNLQLYIATYEPDEPIAVPVEGPLTPSTWNSQHAKWSPDGKWLTFHGADTESGENGICLLEVG